MFTDEETEEALTAIKRASQHAKQYGIAMAVCMNKDKELVIQRLSIALRYGSYRILEIIR